MNKILITGGAGFIGSSLAKSLINNNMVCVIDNLNDYYNPKIKESNISKLKTKSSFYFEKIDIRDIKKVNAVFKIYKPHVVIHLAAMCGIRASLKNKRLYEEVNIFGTNNIITASKSNYASQFIFASSSSVYGNSKNIPFMESEKNLLQTNPYGNSKYKAEKIVLTHFPDQSTILRFFTVYGPHGRPDMAPYIFTKSILEKKEIVQFGNGSSKRDYTYIDDIVRGIELSIKNPTKGEIINLGNSNPITLSNFIKTIEDETNKTAIIKNLQKNFYEMDITYADISKAKKLLEWEPQTPIKIGVHNLAKWIKETL